MNEQMQDEFKSNTLREKLFNELKNKYKCEEITALLEKAKGLKVLIIGDIIIDEYAFGETIERAKKEPILVFKYENSMHFAGGILAIANHVAELCNNVTLLTCVGKDNLTKDIIRDKLNKNIQTKFFYNGSDTLIKKRYIDTYWDRKIFEVYNKNSDYNPSEEDILKFLEDNSTNFDMILVGDFGHGVITDKILDKIIGKAKYLSINVQTNSGNLGFNLITKISKADFISLTKEELQLAMHDNKSDIKDLIKRLCEWIDCKKINVTLGKNGILYYENGDFYYCPIFPTEKVIDTIGAGDAVFSSVSLLSYFNPDPLIIPVIGNGVGSLAVRILGNKEPIKFKEISLLVENIFDSKA